MSQTIKSVAGFIQIVFKKNAPTDSVFYYRGHADRKKYKLEPYIFRDPNQLIHEDIMYHDMIASNPIDFADDKSTFEKLVRMQHYSMPTRLLDITSNPLMALYFACNELDGTTGEVVIFTIKKSVIYYFDGDTTSVISNLSRLDTKAKAEVKTKSKFSMKDFNHKDEVQVRRLLHFIREEKPYFLPKIKPEDVRRVICVKCKMSNSRILSQAGAFLLFGLDSQLEGKRTKGITIDRIQINGNAKKTILKQLDDLNINDSTVFPYIENSAKYIKNKFKTPDLKS